MGEITRLLRCAHCGHVGADVRTTIVEAPEGTTTVVMDVEVPERFRAEPRCSDHEACDDRLMDVAR